MRFFENQSLAYVEPVVAFRRADADSAHKFGLIQTVAKKGPAALSVAIETAAKAAKRRDTYAKKLTALGVVLTD